MNDRYLFKAKRLDNGEWIIGSLIQNPFFKGVRSWISSEQEDKTRLKSISRTQALWNSIEVDSTTICQCTGLKDKNGKLIWENDIVEDEKGNLYKAFWRDKYYQFSWVCVNSDIFRIGAKWDLYARRSFEIAVIGNTFDNPELLESEE
jgi:uncharacterized phage protein (TIGR01671 family)